MDTMNVVGCQMYAVGDVMDGDMDTEDTIHDREWECM